MPMTDKSNFTPDEWKLLLASLPKENQDQLREIKRRYKIR